MAENYDGPFGLHPAGYAGDEVYLAERWLEYLETCIGDLNYNLCMITTGLGNLYAEREPGHWLRWKVLQAVKVSK